MGAGMTASSPRFNSATTLESWRPGRSPCKHGAAVLLQFGHDVGVVETRPLHLFACRM